MAVQTQGEARDNPNPLISIFSQTERKMAIEKATNIPMALDIIMTYLKISSSIRKGEALWRKLTAKSNRPRQQMK